MYNAKYVISVARKLGATVFITWEDIVTVNKNMLVTFACELMAISEGYKSVSKLTNEMTRRMRHGRKSTLS